MLNLTRHELITSLQSTLCPACKGTKRAKRTFCGVCYFRLSGEQRNRLYDGLGSGYAEAVDRAMTALAAFTFWLPCGTTKTQPTSGIGEQQGLFGTAGSGPREGMPR